MLIIVEGADKTGKTTLCKQIATQLGFEYFHFGAPGPNPADEYAKFILENGERDIVCDRFYYGELVYGPLLRGKSKITKLQQSVIERLLRRNGAILIHANTPLNIVSNRLQKMGDDMITHAQNIRAYEMFNTALDCATITRLSFSSVKRNSAELFVNEILVGEVMRIKRSRCVDLSAFTGIGCVVDPQTILVGEKINMNVTWLGLPFDNGVSSKFLDKCLRASCINENSLYIVNAITLTTTELNALSPSRDLLPPKVIALSHIASLVLASLGVKHNKIPHPQYWNRFRNDWREYVNIINKAVLS